MLNLLPLLAKYWKPLLSVILIAGSFLYGRFGTDPEVKIQEKIVEKVVEKKVKGETIVVTKREIVTQKPDGTKITVIENINSEEKKETVTATKTDAKKNRRVGVSVVAPKIFDLKSENLDYKVEYGHRIFGDVFLKGGYEIKSKSVSIGFDWDF